eukprot:6232444-Prymnesium_polylepis.1
MQIRQHAPEPDHPTGTHTHTPHTVSLSRERDPKLGSDDDARAARACTSIGKLIGVCLGAVARLAGERSRFEAHRSSLRPPSSFWKEAARVDEELLVTTCSGRRRRRRPRRR